MATKTESEQTTRNFLSSDVVAALLAHYPGTTFEANPTELQAGFRRVSQKYPELLGQVSFGKVGEYVGSATIEAALDSLAVTEFYSRYSKDLVTYELNKHNLSGYYNNFLKPRFEKSGISCDTIKEAANFLCKSLQEIRDSSDRSHLLVLE